MIEVKATKPVKEDHDAHDRYVLQNEDKSSKVPMFLTLFLTGFALYLKSALSGSTKACRSKRGSPSAHPRIPTRACRRPIPPPPAP